MEILSIHTTDKYSIIRGTAGRELTEEEVIADAKLRSIETVLDVSIYKSETYRMDGTWDYEIVGIKY